MKFWENRKRILVILAHPDDPEFFCGATLAKWSREGHEVSYCLLTRGEKGINDSFKEIPRIIELREKEQLEAASIIGVEKVTFLNNQDGFLEPTIDLRKQIVRIIRMEKPDIVVSCDPSNFYIRDNYINHPDHRAAGLAVIDAIFPAAGNELFFNDLITQESLSPHQISEVWLSLPKEQNTVIDVTDHWEIKLKALEKHESQIGEIKQFREKMIARRAKGSNSINPRYEEAFRRITFKD